jgi:hypothetical protein
MIQPLPKSDLVLLQQVTIRREWLRRLREQGNRQCVGLYRGIDVSLTGRYVTVAAISPVRVCAMALLGEIVHGPQWWMKAQTDSYINLPNIGAMAGLSLSQVERIVKLNDGGRCSRTDKLVRPHTYRQIADVIEGWFPR